MPGELLYDLYLRVSQCASNFEHNAGDEGPNIQITGRMKNEIIRDWMYHITSCCVAGVRLIYFEVTQRVI